MPTQSGYGKRLRSGWLLASVLTEQPRDTPTWSDQLPLLDSSPAAACRLTAE